MAYKAPVRDLTFILNEVLEIDRYANQPGFADVSADLVGQILDEGAKFAEEVIAPLNRSGDQEGCHFEDGMVTTPAGTGPATIAYTVNSAGMGVNRIATITVNGQVHTITQGTP